MDFLTVKKVRALIKNNPKIDQDFEVSEQDNQAVIWLNEGWTWNALDGNRSVEIVNLAGGYEPDTTEYLRDAIKRIEKCA